MDDAGPIATEHGDDLVPSPPCSVCGRPMELVMLERFTGWWCPICAGAVDT